MRASATFHPCPGKKLLRSLLVVLGIVLLPAGSLPAGVLSFLPPRSENVITVTDFTPDGSLLTVPSPKSPVYYEACSLGFRQLGRPMAGEQPPKNDEMLALIVKTLVKQGYLRASDKHPPTQFLAFAWGTLRIGGQGPSFGPSKGVLRFLGGAKLGHMMEDADQESDYGIGLSDYRRLLVSKGSLVADMVYSAANDDLYVALIRSYDFQAATQGTLKQLWETRISLPTAGLAMDTSLPIAIVTAGPNIGHETVQPVWVDTADARQGHVEIGEIKVLEYMDPTQHPVIDLTKPQESKSKDK
jgi:hypothetical protein